MNKAVVLGVGAVTSVVVSVGGFGAGVASAGPPNLSGKTYADASQQIASWGAKAVIQTVVGDQLAMDDCLVTGTKKAGFLDSSGRSSGTTYLLDLNCNGVLAQDGKAGGSAASPAGRKMAKQLRTLKWVNEDPTRCDGASWCKSLCELYIDKCSAALQEYVAKL